MLKKPSTLMVASALVLASCSDHTPPDADIGARQVCRTLIDTGRPVDADVRSSCNQVLNKGTVVASTD